MSEYTSYLAEILHGWYEVRRGLMKEVHNIPPARFSFRPTLETRTIAELLHHILELSIVTAEELTRDDTNFQRAPYAHLVGIYAPNISRADTKEKLTNILVEQFKDAEERYQKAGEIYMMQLVPRPDGTRGTRMSILQETIAHEMYHRGQLTVYQRLFGISPAVTAESLSASTDSPLA
jgi:uncharacterized damage-inducible protein DinB